MTDKRVWFITGAGRGMGVDFAKAALAAGNAVVATGRNTDAVAQAVGEAEDLLVVKLDVTSPADAEAAVKAAVDRFGRIDVLVNNAANFYGGLLRGTDARADRAAAGDGPHRPDERHPRRPAGHAQAALGPHHLDLVGRGPCPASSSIPPTPPPSSAWRAGWSRCSPRSRRSASPPPSSTPGSSAPSSSRRSRRPTLTPSIADYAERHAAQRAVVGGPERSAGRRPGQARAARSSRSPARSSRRAASSPAPMPSPSPSRRRRTCRSRSNAFRDLSTSLALGGCIAMACYWRMIDLAP